MSKQYTPNVGAVPLTSGTQSVVIIEENTEIVISQSGPQGPAGSGDGKPGPPGKDGESAYQIAKDHGFVGTEDEWLASLVGKEGQPGPAGQRGERGEIGPEGPAGHDGRGLTVLGHYETEAELRAAHPTGQPGDAWLVGAGYLYVWSISTSDWENVGQLQGPKGDPGQRGERGPEGPAGADSTVPGPAGPEGQRGEPGVPGRDGIDGKDGEPGRDGIDGKDGAPGRDGIDGKEGAPGRDGATGPANHLSIGTVVDADTATATITGDSPNQTLNLGLPRGPRGEKGEKGDPGTGSASHRGYIWDDEDPAWKNVPLGNDDVNGYMTVLGDLDKPIALVLGADVVADEIGATIDLINLQGDVYVYSQSVTNYILPFGDSTNQNKIKDGGRAYLVYLGAQPQSALNDSLPQLLGEPTIHLWALQGETVAGSGYELHKPVITSAVAGDHQATIGFTFPAESIPVMGYDFDVTGSGGFWKHYSFVNDGRNEVVLDGLENGSEYEVTMYTFATNTHSPDADKVKVSPHGPIPSAPTILDVSGHWNGAKFLFTEPNEKSIPVKSYVLKDQDGVVHDVVELEGDPATMHSGWFRTEVCKTWTLSMAAKGMDGQIGEYSGVHTVITGPQQLTPNMPTFSKDADINGMLPWTAPARIGLEDGFQSRDIIARNLDGKTADVICNIGYNDKTGVIGPLLPDAKYNLTIRGIYPNGNTAEAKPVQFDMWPSYIKAAPVNFTVDATTANGIMVTVNDPMKPPLTGIEVFIDGHPCGIDAAKSTVWVTKGYTGGVACQVAVRWVEYKDQRSDLSIAKTVTPFAPAPNVPSVRAAQQDVDKVLVRFDKNTAGSSVQTYFLMYRQEGQPNWSKTDVTKDVLAAGQVVVGVFANDTKVNYQFCGSAKNGGGESAFSDPSGIIVWPFIPARAPQGIQMFISGDDVRFDISPDTFAQGDQHVHFTGILVKTQINGGAATTVVKPKDWTGASDWFGAQPGDQLTISFAAQTWGSVQGDFSGPLQATRPKAQGDAPVVVNGGSPKAAS
jgi:hypothetical protein